jgi:hypothetical protein
MDKLITKLLPFSYTVEGTQYTARLSPNPPPPAHGEPQNIADTCVVSTLSPDGVEQEWIIPAPRAIAMLDKDGGYRWKLKKFFCQYW